MGARILYAITGHGYGHATRSVAIAREVLRRYPDARITYSTSVPREFLARSGVDLNPPRRSDPVSGGAPPAMPEEPRESLRVQDYEPGTTERNCFEVDIPATRMVYLRFAAQAERRVAVEAERIRAGGHDCVISDIAAIPIAASARAGVPAVAVSNFTWDWILAPLFSGDPDLRDLPSFLREEYSQAEVYLRLPFHPIEHPFRKVIDLPLVGRRARLSREESLRRLGLPVDPGRPLVLVAIGGLRAGNWPKIRLAGCAGMDFIVVGELPIEFPSQRALFLPDDLRRLLGFADLVAAADAVLAKPGYGTCSECAVNGTPMVGIERRGFAESALLGGGMGRYVPYRDLPLEDFFAGRWETVLGEVLQAGRSAGVREDAAAEAAVQIGRAFGWER